MSSRPELVPLAFDTDEGFGGRARLGLIVLESDQTIEAEIRSMPSGGPLDGVAWYHSRIPMEDEVGPDTLRAMEERIPVAAGLLPDRFGFDAIGYACTSAATLIGSDGVSAAIGAAHPGVPCTDPIAAAVAAFDAIGARRISVVTPYSAEVTAPILDLFERHGIEVVSAGSFLETSDLVVARIRPDDVASAVRTVVTDDAEAVFVSCTSLRTFGIVDELETELGRPVVSSNLALVWHLLRLAGVRDDVSGLGSLLGSAQLSE